MKVDLGFWNSKGEYVEDIQEVNKMDMDKYFEELNDMANFKGFGEKEEIIIDGVNVAGCNHCFEQYGDMLCMMIDQYFCEGNICYYKQLQQLKAENERLKEEIKSLYEEKDCLHKIIDRLLVNAGYSEDTASAEDFENVYEDMQYKNNKLEEYKSCLQEIKEVAEKLSTYTASDERKLDKILQKISEVIE